MKEREVRSLRQALSLHQPARGKRYPDELRGRVVGYALSRREEGASWVTIATELGLMFETVRRWSIDPNKRSASRSMKPVEIVPDDREGLAIVTPSGVRAEGLTLAHVIAVLRALS